MVVGSEDSRVGGMELAAKRGPGQKVAARAPRKYLLDTGVARNLMESKEMYLYKVILATVASERINSFATGTA